MIIWYRTVENFEGQIASVARQQAPAEAEAWLTAQSGDAGLAYIVLDERLLDPALLADLTTNPTGYIVQDGALCREGQPVYIGYTSDPQAALNALRSSSEVAALLTMPEDQLRSWLDTRSTTDVFVLLRDVLAKMARAVGISRT